MTRSEAKVQFVGQCFDWVRQIETQLDHREWVRPRIGYAHNSYLEKQSELLHTTYPRFKGLGLEVIGSGEIEGANKRPCPKVHFMVKKSVIGARLKVSGAQWSESGANAKSFVRGMWALERNIIAFEDSRFEAFPRVA